MALDPVILKGFLRAIARSPYADLPRLVFADWLEENGDPRGEFIRAECLLAAMPRDDPRYQLLSLRRYELQEEHRADWEAPPGLPVRVTFERGMPAVHVSARDLRREPVRSWWLQYRDWVVALYLEGDIGLWEGGRGDRLIGPVPFVEIE